MPNRAILFVDGNNWCHGVESAAGIDPTEIDSMRVASKLVGPRELVGLPLIRRRRSANR
jgi:hypothetical protein